jgi:hypothetical protein
MYLSEMSLFDDEDATIRTLMVTQNTNRFQLDGTQRRVRHPPDRSEGGVDDVEFTAQASAIAAVGKRTLIIEPVKSANNETVSAVN